MYAARRAIGAYAQVGIETSVVDANPHRLIAMLFEGARAAINLASAAIQRGDVLAKVRALTRPSRSSARACRPALITSAAATSPCN